MARLLFVLVIILESVIISSKDNPIPIKGVPEKEYRYEILNKQEMSKSTGEQLKEEQRLGMEQIKSLRENRLIKEEKVRLNKERKQRKDQRSNSPDQNADDEQVIPTWLIKDKDVVEQLTSTYKKIPKTLSEKKKTFPGKIWWGIPASKYDSGNNELKFVNYVIENFGHLFDRMSLEYGTSVLLNGEIRQNPAINIDDIYDKATDVGLYYMKSVEIIWSKEKLTEVSRNKTQMYALANRLVYYAKDSHCEGVILKRWYENRVYEFELGYKMLITLVSQMMKARGKVLALELPFFSDIEKNIKTYQMIVSSSDIEYFVIDLAFQSYFSLNPVGWIARFMDELNHYSTKRSEFPRIYFKVILQPRLLNMENVATMTSIAGDEFMQAIQKPNTNAYWNNQSMEHVFVNKMRNYFAPTKKSTKALLEIMSKHKGKANVYFSFKTPDFISVLDEL